MKIAVKGMIVGSDNNISHINIDSIGKSEFSSWEEASLSVKSHTKSSKVFFKN